MAGAELRTDHFTYVGVVRCLGQVEPNFQNSLNSTRVMSARLLWSCPDPHEIFCMTFNCLVRASRASQELQERIAPGVAELWWEETPVEEDTDQGRGSRQRRGLATACTKGARRDKGSSSSMYAVQHITR